LIVKGLSALADTIAVRNLSVDSLAHSKYVRFIPKADMCSAQVDGSARSPQENLSLTFSLFSLLHSFEYRY